MASEKYTNNAASTLNGAINISTTTVIVTNAVGFPTSGQFRILIGNEIMLVTSVTSNTFTVATRGTIDNTVAETHSHLDLVTHILTKGALDKIFEDNCEFGTCANRPSFEREGRLYFGSDYPLMYRDTGLAWQTYYNGTQITPPVTGGYTWTHGGGTATNTDVTNGPSVLAVTSTGTGDKISKFVKTLPTPPYTLTMRLQPLMYTSVQFCGMCLSDGTKLVLWGWILEANTTKLWTAKYTNLTSFTGEYSTRSILPAIDGDCYLRITDNNTNRIYSYSNDGINFSSYFTVSRTDFLTATQGGVYLGSNAATGVETKMVWMSDA